MQFIEHLTITTGHTRMSPRSEVDDKIIQFISDSIASGGALGVDWAIEMIRSDGAGYVFDILWRGNHAIRSWMCLDAAASDRMWAEANSEDLILFAGTPKQPRTAPWLAVAMTWDALRMPFKIQAQAGDLERCVAWTLIESRAH